MTFVPKHSRRLSMPRIALLSRLGLAGGLLCLSGPASAYDSGSTGADGAFTPLVNTELALPPSGVFNFASVNIPSGVTVTFKRNATNTPVVMLVSGNVTIAGTLNLSGGNAADSGAAGDGNIGDDGLPGKGGPGGYDGGAGGPASATSTGGNGLGPGGGGGGNVVRYVTSYGDRTGGGGAGFSGSGAWSSPSNSNGNTGSGGNSYGTSLLLPLIGGSGGGGGAGGPSFGGSGGGGGGGALLIAASGTVSLTGSITANGGTGGNSAGDGRGATGGAGSGGAIRIVATKIEGNGTLAATSGAARSNGGWAAGNQYLITDGGAGSAGRIRLEAETFTRTAASTPAHSFDQPGPAFVAGFPTLRIASVAGVEAPGQPTGSADIVLPAATPNPVTVGFATTGVPVGNTVKLTVTPQYGTPTTVVSPALSGTTEAAAASVQVNLPEGPSTLSATTTYTVVASVGDELAPYAEGERVKEVTLAAGPGRDDKVILTTVSGKAFETPRAVLARLGG
jgi:hypothetical protein